jgi:sortase A
MLLFVCLSLAGCSRGAQADEQAQPAAAAETNIKVAAAGPVLNAMSPHVAPESVSSTEPEAITEPTALDPAAPVAERADANHALRPLPDRLVMPKLDMDIPVEEIGWSMRPGENGSVYNQWDEADYAAGWHKNSATPGEGGNVVLSGHNNIMGAVFRELDQLSRGDIATLYVDGIAHDYAVERVLIVPETTATAEQRKENAKWIQETGKEQLTLVSCWPRDNNTHRIIVIANPVDN